MLTELAGHRALGTIFILMFGEKAPFEVRPASIRANDRDEIAAFRVRLKVAQGTGPPAALLFVRAVDVQVLNVTLQLPIVDQLLLGDRLLTFGTPGSDSEKQRDIQVRDDSRNPTA